MGKIPTMRKIREESEPYLKKCKNCGHVGLVHQKQKYQNPGRERGKSGDFGECTTCKSKEMNCREFVPE